MNTTGTIPPGTKFELVITTRGARHRHCTYRGPGNGFLSDKGAFIPYHAVETAYETLSTGKDEWSTTRAINEITDLLTREAPATPSFIEDEVIAIVRKTGRYIHPPSTEQ